MTPSTRQQYCNLLAEYDSVIRSVSWDVEKQTDLARRLAALIKTPMDEQEAMSFQWQLYNQGISKP